MDQTLHGVATKQRKETKRTTIQKMVRRHNKEGGNHLEHEGNRQKAMEDIDGGPQAAVDGQSYTSDQTLSEISRSVDVPTGMNKVVDLSERFLFYLHQTRVSILTRKYSE